MRINNKKEEIDMNHMWSVICKRINGITAVIRQKALKKEEGIDGILVTVGL